MADEDDGALVLRLSALVNMYEGNIGVYRAVSLSIVTDSGQEAPSMTGDAILRDDASPVYHVCVISEGEDSGV